MRQISKMSLTTTLAAVLFALVLGFGLSVPSFAGEFTDESNVGEKPTKELGVKTVGNPVFEALTFTSAHDVVQIRSTTSGNNLQVDLEDCCIPGDQYVQRTYCLQNGRIWDSRGKALGNTSSFTGLTTTYKGGSQPMDCVTEIRYGEGVAVFPSGMTVRFRTTAGSNVTTTVQSTVVPLPSQ